MRAGGENEALENWKEFMRLQGKDPDAPENMPPELAAKLEQKEWFDDLAEENKTEEIARPKGRRRKQLWQL